MSDKHFRRAALRDARPESEAVLKRVPADVIAGDLFATAPAQSAGLFGPTQDFRFGSNEGSSAPLSERGSAAPESTGRGALSFGTLTLSEEAQWNLTGSAGINVAGVWDASDGMGYTGSGIRVAVVDNGFDYRHVELSSSYALYEDYDARSNDYDAFSSATDDNHGTAVAGVIASDVDGSGMAGVAYDATILGLRIGYGSFGSPGQYANALNKLLGFTYTDAVKGIINVAPADVANCSWGFSGPFSDNFNQSTFASSAKALLDNAMLGRGGLGTTIVFSAGNGRSNGENVNYHNFQNSPYSIAVAATDSAGKIASFSTPGAAVLVSAPGVSIYTTDRLGSAGYTSGDYVTISGTSFSAPTVSGVVALMLQANPSLGYRDVQEILAYSSRLTDAANTGWDAANGAKNWNGGGLHFSHDYGFGLVDATAAVRLAESWEATSTYVPPVQVGAEQPFAKIPDAGRGTLSRTINVDKALTLDKVVVDLDISHNRPSDLSVTLTHVETGTQALLIARPGSGTSTGTIKFTTSANNFWGEDASGSWTLAVRDHASKQVGTLNSWALKMVGDTSGSNDTYVFTNEYKGGKILSDASGVDTINAAAVSDNTVLDLSLSQASTIAGKSLSLGASVIENAWLGDGHDRLTGNAMANDLNGGRGNDTMAGRGGSDTLTGGAGADLFAFFSVAESAAGSGDTIIDFGADDVIDLRTCDASTADGFQSFAAFFTEEQNSYSAGDLFYDRAAGVLYGEADNTAGWDFEVGLANRFGLAKTDLWLSPETLA